MGYVVAMLSERHIDPKPSAWGHRLTIEDCEDIHLHYRNRRLEFSDEEYLAFADSVTEAAKVLRAKRAGTSEAGMVLSSRKLDPVCKFYPNKFTIEANADGSFHFHVRDLRIDSYSQKEFEIMSSSMVEAFINYIDYRLTKATRICIKVPLCMINPFDAAHRLLAPGEAVQYPAELVKHGFMAPPNEEHNRKIDEVVAAMKAGKRIRPIAVRYGNPIMQRKDGFCRYWAHKVLGLAYIECVIGRQTVPGVQGGKSVVVDDKEYEALLAGEGY